MLQGFTTTQVDTGPASIFVRYAGEGPPVHVPMSEVPERLAELPADGQVLVVCKVGGRSARVVQYLLAQGIDAVNLDGGLLEWEAAGKPLVSDAGDPMVV